MGGVSVGTPIIGAWRRQMTVLLAMVTAVAMLTTGAGLRATASLGKQVDVIVQKASSLDQAPEAVVKRFGGTVERDFWIINGFSARVPKAAIGAIQSLPGVLGVTPNRRVRVKAQYGQDSGVASAVYTDVTRASRTWAAGYNGAGVNVALIDTGVNASGDLLRRVIHAEDFTPEQNFADSYGHGTFVAGLIAGTGAGSNGAVKGTAPGANIVSIKIAGASGFTDVTRLLAALEWVVTFKDAWGIRVLNLSLGTDSNQSYRVDPLDFAVERVWNSGVVVVVASGNHGNAAGTIAKPADDPMVVTVGSSDDRTTVSRDDDTLAAFSGVGPTAGDRLAKPDVLAPGKSVVSSRSPGSTIDQAYSSSEIAPSYFKGSGTSFSSGVVSGIAALIISRNWNLTPNQVKARLMGTARPLSNVARSAQGYGQVDAYNATMSDNLTSANQNVTPAAGGGSLQATRGSSAMYNPDGTKMTDDQANAALGFDPNQYFGNSWAGSQWTGSQWTGSQWTGSQWTGSQWTGSQWTGVELSDLEWSGTQWY